MDTTDLTGASGWSAPVISDTLGRHARVRKMVLPSSFTETTRVPYIEVSREATWNVPNGYTTPIAWDHVDEDADGMVIVGSPADLVIRSGGIWTAAFNAVWLSAASGYRFAAIQFNRDFVPGVTWKSSGAGFDPATTLTITRRLRRGDTVQALVQSDSATDLGTVPPPRLRLARIGA